MPRIKKTVKPIIEKLYEEFSNNIEQEKEKREYLLKRVNRWVRETLLKLAKSDFERTVVFTLSGFTTSYITRYDCHLKTQSAWSRDTTKEFYTIFFEGLRLHENSYDNIKDKLRFKNMDFEKTNEYIQELFGNEYSGTASQKSLIFNPYKTYFENEVKPKLLESISLYLTENNINFNIVGNDVEIDFSQFK